MHVEDEIDMAYLFNQAKSNVFLLVVEFEFVFELPLQFLRQFDVAFLRSPPNGLFFVIQEPFILLVQMKDECCREALHYWTRIFGLSSRLFSIQRLLSSHFILGGVFLLDGEGFVVTVVLVLDYADSQGGDEDWKE